MNSQQEDREWAELGYRSLVDWFEKDEESVGDPLQELLKSVKEHPESHSDGWDHCNTFNNAVDKWLAAGCPGLKKEPVPGETIRVRIAVAVGSFEGKDRWSTGGHNGCRDDTAQKDAVNRLGLYSYSQTTTHWIEADVPAPPKPQTIEGRVVS